MKLLNNNLRNIIKILIIVFTKHNSSFMITLMNHVETFQRSLHMINVKEMNKTNTA